MNWLAHYERYWTQQLDRLAAFLEEEDKWPASPASPSSAASKPRPRKSTKPGRSPKKMIQWWGVTGHHKTPIAETDLRVGGRFRVQFLDAGRRASKRERRLSRDRASHEARLLLGLAKHARARESQVTIDLKPDHDGTILDADPRAVLQRDGTRRSSRRLEHWRSTIWRRLFA